MDEFEEFLNDKSEKQELDKVYLALSKTFKMSLHHQLNVIIPKPADAKPDVYGDMSAEISTVQVRDACLRAIVVCNRQLAALKGKLNALNIRLENDPNHQTLMSWPKD